MKFLSIIIVTAFSFIMLGAQEEQHVRKEQNKDFRKSLFQEMSSAGASHENLPFYAISSKGPKVYGSHYKESEWRYGVILTNEGEKFLISAKYNALLDEIHFQADGQIRKILPEVIAALSINNRVYVYHDYENRKGEKVSGYLEQLGDAEVNLYVRYFSETVKDTGSPLHRNINSGNITHVLREKYYASFSDDGIAQPIKKSKKVILGLMKDKAEAVRLHAKKERLSFRDKEDLKQIFEFYASL